MFQAAFRFWMPFALALACGGALLALPFGVHPLHAVASAAAGFAAVVVPAEWMRHRITRAQPQHALPIAMGKFGMTILLLAAAASAMGDNLAPAPFLFGVVLATLSGVLRLRNFSRQNAEIGGNS